MLLTIAIPTYRRPQLLKKNLLHMLPQVGAHSDVSILVVDDSDGSENRLIVENVARLHPGANLVYSLNINNLGIDKNIVNCIRTSRSTYVWLMGEDDLLTEGAVDKVVAALRNHAPKFLFANYVYCNNDHHRYAQRPVVTADPGIHWINFDEFIAKNIWALGFIGGCVLERNAWLSTKLDRYAGTFYSHVGGILDYCLGHPICVVGDTLVLNRAEDADTFTWSHQTFDVYFSFYTMLNASRVTEQPALLEKCLASASKLFAIYSLKWLAAKRADMIFNPEVFSRHYKQDRHQGSLWKVAARLIASAPIPPLRTIRRAQLRRRFVRTTL